MRARVGERGYALVALMAAITIMMIAMATALPSWRYVMKDDREEELIFRGLQIADAVKIYRRKRGNAYPTSIELLVKEKCLRKAYKDPMTSDGKWRMIRPDERIPVQVPGVSPQPTPSPTPSSNRRGGTTVGPFSGVASRSTEKSLRLFVGNDHYDKWLFFENCPRWIGKAPRNILQPRPTPTPTT